MCLPSCGYNAHFRIPVVKGRLQRQFCSSTAGGQSGIKVLVRPQPFKEKQIRSSRVAVERPPTRLCVSRFERSIEHSSLPSGSSGDPRPWKSEGEVAADNREATSTKGRSKIKISTGGIKDRLGHPNTFKPVLRDGWCRLLVPKDSNRPIRNSIYNCFSSCIWHIASWQPKIFIILRQRSCPKTDLDEYSHVAIKKIKTCETQSIGSKSSSSSERRSSATRPAATGGTLRRALRTSPSQRARCLFRMDGVDCWCRRIATDP